MTSHSSRRTGFTLVEAATSWGFVTLLVALLLPAVQQAREAARRSQCQGHLKMLGLALYNYESSHATFPFGWVGVDAKAKQPAAFGSSGWGWGALLLPYNDNLPLYDRLNFSSRADEKDNAKLLVTPMPWSRCPSDPFVAKSWKIKDSKGAVLMELATTNYVASFGTEDLAMCEKSKLGKICEGNGLFYHNSHIRIAHVTDGTSNTLAIGERVGDEKVDHLSTWSGVIAKGTHPFARILGSSHAAFSSKARHASDYRSPHVGGSQFLLTDGSVRFISKNVDFKTFQGLTTRSGGEVLDDF